MAKKNAADWAKEQTQETKFTAIKLPEGIEYHKLKIGEEKLNVLPYLAGERNPSADPGETWWNFKYVVHWIPVIGGKSRPYCCLRANWNERCPVCEYKAEAALAKALIAKGRIMMNVSIPDDPQLKIKILDEPAADNAQGGFIKVLADRINKKKEKYGGFYELKGGYTLELSNKERTFPGGKKIEPISIDMEERDDLPASILKKTVCLENCLVKTDPEVLEKLVYQGVDPSDHATESVPERSRHDHNEEEKSEERPARREEKQEEKPAPKKATPKADDNDDDKTAEELGIKQGSVVRYRGQIYAVSKVSKDGTSLTLTDQEGEHETGVNPNNINKVLKDKKVNEKGKIVNIEEEDEKPAPKKAVAKKSSEDDDEDDDPPPSRSKAKAEPVTAGRRGSYDDDDSDDDEE